jgi:hypothetical protein
MIKTIATIFGIVFLAVGVLGFVPGATTNGHLLGIFHVNAAHNIVHIMSGIAALIAAGMGHMATRNYFRIFGVVYGLVAVLGFMQGDQPVLGLLANNAADTWLHVGIAVVSLVLGFVQVGERVPGGSATTTTP